MNWVVDCSFTAALFLPDEGSDKVRGFFMDLAGRDTVWVPSLWWPETANVLSVAEKRKRINGSDVYHVISLFEGLGLETDPGHGPGYVKTIYGLSLTAGISAYDAAYLELCMRKRARLASLDRKLVKAAEKTGIKPL